MTDEIVAEFPDSNLPPGFAERVGRDELPDVAQAKPAATVLLLRDGATGLEVLLMKRHRQAGFVPGAYVFPGGRVDPGDADPLLLASAGPLPPSPDPSYRAAAVREAFEETGILLARDPGGEWAPDAGADSVLASWRARLLSDSCTLHDLLAVTALVPELAALVHFAHWITPEAEPRRYDTRFFLAAVPEGRDVSADPREMSDAVWLTPAAALARFEAGGLPMVFPTVHALRRLAEVPTVAGALERFRGEEVRPVLPRLVRTRRGVAIVVDEEEGGA